MALLFALAVSAQTIETEKNELSVWGGFSPDSSTIITGTGRTEDARFGLVAVRYARRFNNSDKVNLKYTLDLVPAAILSNPDFRFVPTGANTFRIDEFRRRSYAFGIIPVGLQINFRPRKKVQPFIEGSGGFFYFNKRIPNDIGTRFTFTADVGGGAEIRLKKGRAVTVGYKYFHLSNGNRGFQNPGIDNNLIYVGYTFKKF
ncbi:MAG: acyloxyacyl hydrolase [Acidobacteria bacterium]|nr:acyloxyacyl hydrolase [Acidobacteriota bacterium]